VQVHTYTLHTHTSFQSGTIAFATLTSLLPTLVRCFAGSNLPLCSLLDHSQAAQARLATSKLPQPLVHLVDIAAAPAILRSSVCTTRRETRILVLAVLVLDCRSRITIQKAGHQGDSSHQVGDTCMMHPRAAPPRSCSSMQSINLPIAFSMAAASGSASQNSSSSRQGPPLSMSGSAGGCCTSGPPVFASRLAPRNPVKQGSVQYNQVCTYKYLVHISMSSVHTRTLWYKLST
jgi:hypothetical protein